jgi:V8-like Glu-specific endopeptidase
VFWSTGPRIAAVAACVLVGVSPLGGATAWAGGGPSSDTGANAGDASYWTAERMQAAQPVQPRTGAGTITPRVHAAMAAGASQGAFSDGIPEVGTFFVDTPAGDTTCTGSVVHSPGKDLVLSAGHCLYGWRTGTAHRIFVPKYTGGLDAAHQPYGFFPVQSVFVDPRFSPQPATSTHTDLDFGFVSTGTDSAGAQLEDVTGALTLTTTPSYRNTVTVLGYPSKAHNPSGRTWSCTVATAPLPAYHQMQMTCPGFYGGTSGGPWIADYNADTHTGNVIGETGGLDGGGDTDWVSYSPMFDKQIQALYADAVNGAVSARTPYRSTPAPGGLPGASSVWKKARLLASGDYTGHHRSDLIVVWADGKVSMFPSDGNGGYAAEKVLTKANTRWRSARLITGGDFDGGSRFDLMVVWNNGTLSNFADTTSTKLGTEKKYAAPAGVSMKSALQITAGQFGNTQYVTDLVVLWKDGELSLYSNTGSGKLGPEHQLRKPSTTWKNATVFSSGQYNHSSTWDLMVRWVDGELDNYPGVNRHGIGAEHRLLKSNTTWRQATAITTGHYTANAYADDVLVRWADGHLSRYPDTTLTHLGPDQPLTTAGS